MKVTAITGEELYLLYKEVHITENNCEVENWAELRETERKVWFAMAAQLRAGDLP